MSKISQAQLVFGKIERGEELVLISQMPENGVIFSDGIETDYLMFNSGSIAHIRLAQKQGTLICKG